MSAPYFARLACLSLAAFFAINFSLSALIALGTPRLIRRITRDASPRFAARLLFALRIAPAALAFVCVLALCVPSYLLLEPEFADEEVGWLCGAAALCAVAGWALSLRRASRALRAANRFEAVFPAHPERPMLAMAGFMRPRLLLSQRLSAAFTADQLDAALRHEEAHFAARDNLKRLAMLAVPRFGKSAAGIESAWAEQAEQAADDAAIGGDPARAVALASALVALARMGSAGPKTALVCSLSGERGGLAARVDRLLAGAEPKAESERRLKAWMAGAAAIPTLGAMLAWANPAAVHAALEGLMR